MSFLVPFLRKQFAFWRIFLYFLALLHFMLDWYLNPSSQTSLTLQGEAS